jgi:hypothetical protein
MTNDEFNRCKLKKRLDFRMAEAARFVLVVGGSVDDAVKLYCQGNKQDRENVIAAIALFDDALSD